MFLLCLWVLYAFCSCPCVSAVAVLVISIIAVLKIVLGFIMPFFLFASATFVAHGVLDFSVSFDLIAVVAVFVFFHSCGHLCFCLYCTGLFRILLCLISIVELPNDSFLSQLS